MKATEKCMLIALALMLLLVSIPSTLGEESDSENPEPHLGEVVEEEIEELFDMFGYGVPLRDGDEEDEDLYLYGYETPIFRWLFENIDIVAQDTFDGVTWCLVEDGTLILGHGDPQAFVEDPNRAAEDYPWYAYRDMITSLLFCNEVKGADSLAHAFDGLDNLKSITGRENFDLSDVSDTSAVFPERKLVDAPFPDWWGEEE